MPASKLPGVGTTIFTVMSRLAAETGAINLGQGFPDFDPPARLRELVAHHLGAGHNQYAPMAGLPALCEAIAESAMRRHGWRIDAGAEITVTAGGTEAIFAAIHAVVHVGEEVILLDPSYDSYGPAAELAGARVRRVPLSIDDFGIVYERLAEAITPKTRLLVVNTPLNPAGAVLTAADWDRIADLLDGTNAYVLSDEVYESLVYDGRRHAGVLANARLRERAFAVFSFGKTYNATGWKVGYCVAAPPLTAEFRKVHQFLTFAVSTPVQHAIADFMREMPRFPGRARAFLPGSPRPLRVAACRIEIQAPARAWDIFPAGGLLGGLRPARRAVLRGAGPQARGRRDSVVSLLRRAAGGTAHPILLC